MPSTETNCTWAAARAYNMMTADMFAPYRRRFAPVAIMPARTPEEAIEELEYAVGAARLQGDHAARQSGAADPGRSAKASIRRKPPGTATPSRSTARTTTSRFGSAASSSASR